MNSRIGIAILGCGYWGINYIRVFSELPNTYIAVICDKRVERLKEIARRFPDVQTTTEVDEALRMEGVDAVVVCTEASTHYSVTRECLLQKKHVLIEKPITTISTDAERLIDLAGSTTVLMVGQTFMYNSGVRKIKEYILNDRIGRVYYMYARRTNLGPIRQDVNALWDLAPHDISIFNYWLDQTPVWVSAVGAKVLRNCRDDVGFISLGYQDGIVGHIHVSWADPNKVREVVVVGSNQRIVFDDLNPLERVRVFEKGIALAIDEPINYGQHNLQIRDGDIISPSIDVSEPLKTQCNHFLECIAQGSRPISDGWVGLQIVRVMEAIDRSINSNGAPIEVLKEHYCDY